MEQDEPNSDARLNVRSGHHFMANYRLLAAQGEDILLGEGAKEVKNVSWYGIIEQAK